MILNKLKKIYTVFMCVNLLVLSMTVCSHAHENPWVIRSGQDMVTREFDKHGFKVTFYSNTVQKDIEVQSISSNEFLGLRIAIANQGILDIPHYPPFLPGTKLTLQKFDDTKQEIDIWNQTLSLGRLILGPNGKIEIRNSSQSFNDVLLPDGLLFIVDSSGTNDFTFVHPQGANFPLPVDDLPPSVSGYLTQIFTALNIPFQKLTYTNYYNTGDLISYPTSGTDQPFYNPLKPPSQQAQSGNPCLGAPCCCHGGGRPPICSQDPGSPPGPDDDKRKSLFFYVHGIDDSMSGPETPGGAALDRIRGNKCLDIKIFKWDKRRCPEDNAKDLVDGISRTIKNCKYCKLIIVGHSAGGIIAALAAKDIADQNPNTDIEVTTVASPLAGYGHPYFPTNIFTSCTTASIGAGGFNFPDVSNNSNLSVRHTRTTDNGFNESDGVIPGYTQNDGNKGASERFLPPIFGGNWHNNSVITTISTLVPWCACQSNPTTGGQGTPAQPSSPETGGPGGPGPGSPTTPGPNGPRAGPPAKPQGPYTGPRGPTYDNKGPITPGPSDPQTPGPVSR